MNRKRGVNNENKLLYDPNQRRQRRLGAFSMEENYDEDDENKVAEQDEDLDEEQNAENVTQQEAQPQESNLRAEDSKESGTTIVNGIIRGVSKIASKILSFLLANPMVLIALAGIVVFFIIIILIFAAFDSDSDDEAGNVGLYGYEYLALDNVCETVRVYNPETNSYTEELDFETEYIPGVVQAEVGLFTDAPEVLKLFAIAARSYALTTLDESCTIEGSARVQAFTYDEATLERVTAESHPIMQAVMNTYGLVAVKDGELLRTYYDAACYRGQDEDNYFIGYGSITLGEEREQAIPKSWASERAMMGYINSSIANNTYCYGNHGYGISQYGAYYLATQEDYTMEDLMAFYNGEVKIYSIYEGVSTNYTLATSEGTTDILTISLREFFESEGTSVEAFNEYILSNILNAGVGTRNAAIVTAVSTVGSLYQYYGVRIPYTLCGQHYCSDMYNSSGVNVNRSGTSFYGVDPNWGSKISNNSLGTYSYYYLGSMLYYTNYGPDCSGFISWLLHNAGFNTTVLGSIAQGNFGPKYALNGSQVGQPGDLLWNEGHVMFIVGVDSEAELYYIAHASSGTQGVKISTMSFTSPGNYAVDMTEWYENNRMDVTDEEFVEIFRAGYVDGYTGEYDALEMAADSGIYFVGDSRTVGLCYTNSLCKSTNSCQTNTCLAKVSMGYDWFRNQISTIRNNSQSNVVINMGINDLVGNADASSVANNYFALYSDLASSTPQKTIYIMSVNPVDDGVSVSQSKVEAFNDTMEELIANSNLSNLEYIDAYNNVTFVTTDGLHYNANTYRALYQYITRVV